MQKVNLKKLCVGSDGIDSLRDWQKELIAQQESVQKAYLAGKVQEFEHFLLPYHDTRNMPKNIEGLAGGSLYWIRKSKFFARQKIHLLERRTDEMGQKFCRIWLEAELVEVKPLRHKPFQGWRYLKLLDSPPDKDGENAAAVQSTEDMERELQRMGLL